MFKIITILFAFPTTILALNCYQCIYGQNTIEYSNLTCLPSTFNKNNATIEKCSSQEKCSILRIELQNETYTNKPIVFIRGCWSDPLIQNVELDIGNLMIYQYTCDTDNCNTGNGYKAAELRVAEEVEWNFIGAAPSQVYPFKLLIFLETLLFFTFKL